VIFAGLNLLADSDESWVKLIIPLVIVVFSIISSMVKSRNADGHGEKKPQNGAQGRTAPPQRQPQRPVPHRYTERHLPPTRRPQPASPPAGKTPPAAPRVDIKALEQKLKDKLQRAEAAPIPVAVPVDDKNVPASPVKTPAHDTHVRTVENVQFMAGPLDVILKHKDTLRQAVILREILDKPLALR